MEEAVSLSIVHQVEDALLLVDRYDKVIIN